MKCTFSFHFCTQNSLCIASIFLRKEEQNKIKVLIRIAPVGHIDTEEVYCGNIPSNIFDTCKKQD